MTKVTSECLLKIRDLILEEGWRQYDYGNREHGYCLIGAWSAACLGWDIWEHDGAEPPDEHGNPPTDNWSLPLADALGLDDVAEFNDYTADTADEIITLLETRAAALKGDNP